LKCVSNLITCQAKLVNNIVSYRCSLDAASHSSTVHRVRLFPEIYHILGSMLDTNIFWQDYGRKGGHYWPEELVDYSKLINDTMEDFFSTAFDRWFKSII